MTLDNLVVKISADTSDIKKKIADLKTQLAQASDKSASLGSTIAKVAGKASLFALAISAVKKGIEGFISDNPNSGLARFKTDLDGVVKGLRDVMLLPITATLDQVYGKASNVKVELKEINLEFKDLSKYYKLVNKEIQQNKSLLGGFDELNILSKSKQDSDGQEELNELTDYYVDLENQRYEIEKQIDQIYQEYANEIGLTVDQYKTLYTLWSNGHEEKAKEMVEGLGKNWKDVENNLTNFANNGIPKIEELQGKLKDLGDEMERVLGLINLLGGKKPEVKHDRLDHSNDDNTDTPGAWANHVGGRTWKSAQDLAQEEYEVKGLAAQGIYTTPGIYHSGNTMITGNQAVLDAFNNYNNRNQDQVIDAVAQVGGQIVSAIANQNLEVSIGDDVIASSAARGNRAYRMMTGQDIFQVK